MEQIISLIIMLAPIPVMVGVMIWFLRVTKRSGGRAQQVIEMQQETLRLAQQAETDRTEIIRLLSKIAGEEQRQ